MDWFLYDRDIVMKTFMSLLFRKLWIWSHLLEQSLMENFIFCAVLGQYLNRFVNQYLNHYTTLLYVKNLANSIFIFTSSLKYLYGQP